MSAPIALTFLALQAVAAAAAPPPVPANVVTSAPAEASAAPADPVMCQRIADPDNPVPKKVCHKASVWARMARGD